MDDFDAESAGASPVNTTPEVVSNLFSIAVVFLQNYGWYLVIGIIAILYLKSRLQPKFARWLNTRSEQVNLHRYDDDGVLKRQQALEESRRRMQENFNMQAARYAEEQQKKEEEKRRQLITDWDRHVQGRGYRSKYRPPDESGAIGQSSAPSPASHSKKKVYRTDDYNPLTGGGSGSCYRPDRRSGARGGGG